MYVGVLVIHIVKTSDIVKRFLPRSTTLFSSGVVVAAVVLNWIPFPVLKGATGERCELILPKKDRNDTRLSAGLDQTVSLQLVSSGGRQNVIVKIRYRNLKILLLADVPAELLHIFCSEHM